MDREFAQFERLESSLRELGEAERVGVFGRTRVDANAMFARPVVARSNRVFMFRVGSIAAVLLVALTVWSVMFVGQVRHLQDRARMVTANGTDGPFYAKLTGPAVAVATKNPNDFDGDGDLDLADIRTFQLQFAVNR